MHFVIKMGAVSHSNHWESSATRKEGSHTNQEKNCIPCLYKLILDCQFTRWTRCHLGRNDLPVAAHQSGKNVPRCMLQQVGLYI